MRLDITVIRGKCIYNDLNATNQMPGESRDLYG
jgi:hypothetical protein